MSLLDYVKTRVHLRVRRALSPMATITTRNGYRMRVDLRDEFVARELFASKAWEPELQRLAECAVLEGGIAVDIGANIGVHTIHFSRLTGPAGFVYAFEPEAYNFSLLQKNVELNRVRNVSAQQAAIGDVNGTVRMQVAKSNLGDHRVTPGAGDVDVRVIRLDDALPDSTAGRIRLIKIDVQGYESHVLRGMARTLDRNPDAIVLTEMFPLYLRDAGSSASEFLSLIEAVSLCGWEINDYRIAPIASGWVYERFLGRREENLVLCRNPRRLSEVLSRYFGADIPVQTPGIR